ncbi:MAG: hypothetical protein M3003_12120 [Candidatus Dormibacteraeota bacterium]|nr:hypothetical protein [Candidatus Dormibacteraeota bacterium]
MALTDWHSPFPDGVNWRLTPAGVEIKDSGVERTRGEPTTAIRVWEAFATEINSTARDRRVPCALILGLICTESGGEEGAVRTDRGYTSDEKTPDKVHIGVTGLDLAAAREVMQLSFDRWWLIHGCNAIVATAAVLADQWRQTSFDPPLVAAQWNVGTIAYENARQNRWKLRGEPPGTGRYVDRFVRFFNDAVAVLNDHPVPPSVGLDQLLGDSARQPPSAASRVPTTRSIKIDFGPNAKLDAFSDYTRDVLTDLLKSSGLTSTTVTSTFRTPEQDAWAMFTNVEHLGVDHEMALYAAAGKAVIRRYAKSKKEHDGEPKDERAQHIVADMVDEINKQGPINVSHHEADPKVLNTFDLSPRSIANRCRFEEALRAERRLSKYFVPPKDASYHLEVPQPK